jgi:esterase
VNAALELATSRFGEGPPLLVLHGLLGSSRNWQGIGKQLGRRFAVWTVDLRNHGHSPWSDEMDYPAMAADLARLIREQAGAPAAVLGHSMGGKAAMALALGEPALVERLVVADIAPVTYGHGFLGYIRAMQAADLAAADRRAVEAALVVAAPEPAIRSFLMQNLERHGEGYRWRPNLAVLAERMSTILAFPDEFLGERYDGPCLFLRGERSEYVLPAHEPRIRALFPRAEIATVPGTGHWLHAEAPAAFVEIVGRFLAG